MNGVSSGPDPFSQTNDMGVFHIMASDGSGAAKSVYGRSLGAVKGSCVAAVGLGLLLVLWGCAASERLTAPSADPPLYGKIYRPAARERHPGVIFLHGIYGVHPDQHAFARRLADHGYVVLVLDYYRGLGAGDERNRETYGRVVRQAVLYHQGLPEVDPQRIGLVGFSQGAFLAVSAAGAAPAVKAVVSFYGGAPRDLDRYVHLLPPTLILHGEADDDVPVALAYRLRDEMLSHGRIVEMQVYPQVRHSFGQGGTHYDAKAAQDGEERALSFLERHLMSAYPLPQPLPPREGRRGRTMEVTYVP